MNRSMIWLLMFGFLYSSFCLAAQLSVGTGLHFRLEEREENIRGFYGSPGISLGLDTLSYGGLIEYVRSSELTETSDLGIKRNRQEAMIWGSLHPFHVGSASLRFFPMLEAGIGWAQETIDSRLGSAQSSDSASSRQEALGAGVLILVRHDKSLYSQWTLTGRAYHGGLQTLDPSFGVHLGLALGFPVLDRSVK